MLGGHLYELIIVLIIALVVFGPKRLPELGSSLGKGIREFRKATNELHDSIKVEGTEALPPEQPRYTASDYVAPTRAGSARPDYVAPQAHNEPASAEYTAAPAPGPAVHSDESETPRA
jgi:sec-independent protein translocase protein TatA